MTAFQLEDIVAALRHAIACNIKPGDATVRMLNRIRRDFQGAADGDPIVRVPEIDDTYGPADILVVAELLHRTVFAFLTPEEAEDHRKIGFDSEGVRAGGPHG